MQCYALLPRVVCVSYVKIRDDFQNHTMVPILATLCYLVVNLIWFHIMCSKFGFILWVVSLVSYCGKHTPLNANATRSVINNHILVLLDQTQMVYLFLFNSLYILCVKNCHDLKIRQRVSYLYERGLSILSCKRCYNSDFANKRT